MSFKVINNFLEKTKIDKIENILTDPSFPWFYLNSTATLKDKSNFLFTHILYENERVTSNFYNLIVTPVLKILNKTNITRAKLNFYTKREKQIKTQFHIDRKDNHTVALFSFNTNNGYTDFKNGKKIKSIKNKLVLFPGNLEHRSVNQTDKDYRINLNINFKDVI